MPAKSSKQHRKPRTIKEVFGEQDYKVAMAAVGHVEEGCLDSKAFKEKYVDPAWRVLWASCGDM